MRGRRMVNVRMAAVRFSAPGLAGRVAEIAARDVRSVP